MNRRLKTAGQAGVVVAAMGLGASTATAATFPFEIVNATWNAATLGGTNYLDTVSATDVSISGLLTGTEISSGIYEVTGISGFTVTTSDASLQSAIDSLRLIDDSSTPSDGLQIAWDGLDPFGWTIDDSFFFGEIDGPLTDGLAFLGTGIIVWQLNGIGDPGGGDTTVNIEASGDLGAGAAAVPLPPAALGLLGALGLAWTVGGRRRRKEAA